jgi:glyceraldehyde-3-phosphate dehydrogenase (NADP+)
MFTEVNGEDENMQDMQTIDVRDKYSGEVIGGVPSVAVESVPNIIKKVYDAFANLNRLPSYKRAEILAETSSLINIRQDDFAKLIAREGGKPLKYSRKEAKRAALTMQFSSEEAKRLHGETIPFDAEPRGQDRTGYWYRVPAGVVAAITPFNDPLNLVAHKLGPAIAAGNTVVLKPASLTPLSALKLVETLQEAGLSEDCIQVITGDGETLGPAIVSDPHVRVVTFTGGIEAGKKIVKLAGLKKIAMELGSNCPVIVMDDAPLSLAETCILDAGYNCQGQNCIHAQRVLIHELLYEQLVESLVHDTEKLRVGNPLDEATDIGPMIAEREALRVEEWVNEALHKGAELLTGGERKKNLYMPTILANVPREATIATEEIFGPVMIVSRFRKIEDAILESNNTTYGLHAGIFTKSIDNAMKAVSELNFGSVLINDTSDFRVDFMPFGGMKSSGLGREGIRFAIEETMTEIKTVIFKKVTETHQH